jgi:hypothetical protein
MPEKCIFALNWAATGSTSRKAAAKTIIFSSVYNFYFNGLMEPTCR